jgi:hypothetical protein
MVGSEPVTVTPGTHRRSSDSSQNQNPYTQLYIYIIDYYTQAKPIVNVHDSGGFRESNKLDLT